MTISPQTAAPLPVQFEAADPQVVPQGMVGTTTVPLYFGRNDFAVLGLAEAGEAIGGIAPAMAHWSDICLARPGEHQCLPVGDRCVEDPGLFHCRNQWRGPWAGSGYSIGGGSGFSSGGAYYLQRSFQKIPLR